MSDHEVFPGMSVGDVIALIGAGAVVGPGVLVTATGQWTEAMQWALAHGLLVGAGADPLVVVPKAHGAGLDTARLLAGVMTLVLVAALFGYAWWRWRRARLNRLARKGLV